MKTIIETIRGKMHDLVLEESEVLETLRVVNAYQKWYIDQKLAVGHCEWDDEPTKWYLSFNATSNQWKHIVNDLTIRGYVLEIRDHSENLYLIRNKVES